MSEEMDDFLDVSKKASGSSVATSVAAAAALLGADLVVVALAWDNPPSEGGIVTITFLMMISFVFFINALHQTMRYDFLIGVIAIKEEKKKEIQKETKELLIMSKWIRILHVSGLLFTMIAFWIISYKYLISITDYYIVILLLPIILFILYWLPTMIGIEKEVGIFSRESIIQLLVQITFLVLICLDFFKIIKIP